MTQEEKKLLNVELVTRSQYGVICAVKPVAPFHDLEFGGQHKIKNIYIRDDGTTAFSFGDRAHSVENIKPYLRPLSNMTEEEVEEWRNIVDVTENWLRIDSIPNAVDFFNKHHLDYRGWIEKDLALEASEGMYEIHT